MSTENEKAYICVGCELPVMEEDAVWIEEDGYHVQCAPAQHPEEPSGAPPCGCHAIEPNEYVDARDSDAMQKFGIFFCPLHAAAPRMLALLDRLVRLGMFSNEGPRSAELAEGIEKDARALIAEVEQPSCRRRSSHDTDPDHVC